jgi:hypothetical protein
LYELNECIGDDASIEKQKRDKSGKIERDLIARGVFTSVTDLARKIRRYINAYSANAKPIQWKYLDPTRRIRSNEFTATATRTNVGLLLRSISAMRSKLKR